MSELKSSPENAKGNPKRQNIGALQIPIAALPHGLPLTELYILGNDFSQLDSEEFCEDSEVSDGSDSGIETRENVVDNNIEDIDYCTLYSVLNFSLFELLTIITAFH